MTNFKSVEIGKLGKIINYENRKAFYTSYWG